MNANPKSSEPFAQEGYDLIGAALEVHRELGSGLSEEIYQESLEEELALRKMPFMAQPELNVFYKSKILRKKLRPDLIVLADIVVELKAVATLAPEHEAQVINYLKVTRKPVGYLINFCHPHRLEWRRYANTRGIKISVP